jgi:hypothetical protein
MRYSSRRLNTIKAFLGIHVYDLKLGKKLIFSMFRPDIRDFDRAHPALKLTAAEHAFKII